MIGAYRAIETTTDPRTIRHSPRSPSRPRSESVMPVTAMFTHMSASAAATEATSSRCSDDEVLPWVTASAAKPAAAPVSVRPAV